MELNVQDVSLGLVIQVIFLPLVILIIIVVVSYHHPDWRLNSVNPANATSVSDSTPSPKPPSPPAPPAVASLPRLHESSQQGRSSDAAQPPLTLQSSRVNRTLVSQDEAEAVATTSSAEPENIRKKSVSRISVDENTAGADAITMGGRAVDVISKTFPANNRTQTSITVPSHAASLRLKDEARILPSQAFAAMLRDPTTPLSELSALVGKLNAVNALAIASAALADPQFPASCLHLVTQTGQMFSPAHLLSTFFKLRGVRLVVASSRDSQVLWHPAVAVVLLSDDNVNLMQGFNRNLADKGILNLIHRVLHLQSACCDHSSIATSNGHNQQTQHECVSQVMTIACSCNYDALLLSALSELLLLPGITQSIVLSPSSFLQPHDGRQSDRGCTLMRSVSVSDVMAHPIARFIGSAPFSWLKNSSGSNSFWGGGLDISHSGYPQWLCHVTSYVVPTLSRLYFDPATHANVHTILEAIALKPWIDFPNERCWDGAVFNAAVVTLHLFRAMVSSSSHQQPIHLAAVVHASFAPLFIVPSSLFWQQISEYQLLSCGEDDMMSPSSSSSSSPSSPSSSSTSSSTSCDTITSLFILSGIYIHRGLQRSRNFSYAYRHTTPEAAAAAPGDDSIFEQQLVWILAAEWCSAFGRALDYHEQQQQRQNEYNAGVLARLPAWMVEVVCFVIDTALSRRSDSSSYDFSPSHIDSDALKVLTSTLGCRLQMQQQQRHQILAVLSCSSPHIRSQCASLLKRLAPVSRLEERQPGSNWHLLAMRNEACVMPAAVILTWVMAGRGGSGLSFDRLITRRDCFLLLHALTHDDAIGARARNCVKTCLLQRVHHDDYAAVSAAEVSGNVASSNVCLLPLPTSLRDAASSIGELIAHELLSDASDLYSEMVMRSFAVCRLQLQQQQQQQQQHDDDADDAHATLQEDIDAACRSIATDTVLHASSLQLLRLLIVTCDAASLFNTHAADILAAYISLVLRDLVTQRTGLHFLQHDASLYVDIADCVCACADIMNRMLVYAEYRAAVAADERSFDASVFSAICSRLHMYGVDPAATNNIAAYVAAAAAAVDAAAVASRGNDSEDAPAEDIPAEFLDALTCDVMVDPVRLPSGNIVCRRTLQRHIVRSRTDPFTREPLVMAQVTVLRELRSRIESWQQQQRAHE